MTIHRSLAERIAVLPFGADTEHRRLDLSTTPANISLAAGAYEVYNGGSVAAYLRVASGVSIPASGGAAVAGQFVVPAGGGATFVVDGAAAVYGLTSSGTTTVDFLRKPL